MELTRPDLTAVDPQVRAYIEALEADLAQLQNRPALRQRSQDDAEPAPTGPTEPDEPPTTLNLISATASGLAKRTPRHLYSRQHRSGMGVFDLDSPVDQPPALLAIADESANLLAITNLGRAFRLPVSAIPETSVRSRGNNILARIMLTEDETLAALLPDRAEGYLALLSHTGMVRLLRHHVFGEYMKPGTGLYDFKLFGSLAAVCWTPGDGDLFIATRLGRGIRFSEKTVHPQGSLAIRLVDGDQAVAIAPVYSDSGVFMLTREGKGTIRLMEGFSANKTPGAGGKIALSTDALAAAHTVEPSDEIFAISKLGKLIRFRASEVPPKEGVVRGVICMSLRSDEVSAMTISPDRLAL
jgi:DNA gyrase subunit A